MLRKTGQAYPSTMAFLPSEGVLLIAFPKGTRDHRHGWALGETRGYMERVGLD